MRVERRDKKQGIEYFPSTYKGKARFLILLICLSTLDCPYQQRYSILCVDH
jgi:hypothetical protein